MNQFSAVLSLVLSVNFLSANFASANGGVAGEAVRRLLGEEIPLKILTRTKAGQRLLREIGFLTEKEGAELIATEMGIPIRQTEEVIRLRLMARLSQERAAPLVNELEVRLKRAQAEMARLPGQTSPSASSEVGAALPSKDKLKKMIDKIFPARKEDGFAASLRLAEAPLIIHQKFKPEVRPEGGQESERTLAQISAREGAQTAAPQMARGAAALAEGVAASRVVVPAASTLSGSVGVWQFVRNFMHADKLLWATSAYRKILKYVVPGHILGKPGFTENLVWDLRKILGALGGTNSFTELLIEFRTFTEMVIKYSYRTYHELNANPKVIEAGREFLRSPQEEADILKYLTVRKAVAQEYSYNFQDIIWSVEEKMLRALSTCKRLGARAQTNGGLPGRIELAEKNFLEKQRMFLWKKAEAEKLSLQIKALKTKKEELNTQYWREVNSRNEAEREMIEYRSNTQLDVLYLEFTEAYEMLIWGNLGRGVLKRETISAPIELPDPFLIDKGLIEGDWAELYFRAFRESADLLAGREIVALRQTLTDLVPMVTGKMATFKTELNEKTGGKLKDLAANESLAAYLKVVANYRWQVQKLLLTLGPVGAAISTWLATHWKDTVDLVDFDGEAPPALPLPGKQMAVPQEKAQEGETLLPPGQKPNEETKENQSAEGERGSATEGDSSGANGESGAGGGEESSVEKGVQEEGK